MSGQLRLGFGALHRRVSGGIDHRRRTETPDGFTNLLQVSEVEVAAVGGMDNPNRSQCAFKLPAHLATASVTRILNVDATGSLLKISCAVAFRKSLS